MSNKLNLIKFIPLFETNRNFSITESQYLRDTGRSMPKDTSYLKNKSAFSRAAEKYGYSLEIQERTINLKKNK